MDVVYNPYDSRGSFSINNKLEKILNNSIRYIYNLKRSDSITYYEDISGLITIENRRKIHTLNIIHKIMNTEAPQYLKKLIDVWAPWWKMK